MADSVFYDASFTRNMGNFESVKVALGLTTDVRKGETETQALARAKDFVSEQLLIEVDELESEIRGVRTAAESRKK